MSLLLNTPLLFLDCQTTATSPRRGRLLEVGWAISSADEFFKDTVRARHSILVALPPGETIPARVRQITGLTEESLIAATASELVWATLREASAGIEMAVIHYARFEISFLTEVGNGETWPLKTVCAYKVARKALPELASWTLRALSGYFGTPLPEVQRAGTYAEATRRVWAHLAVRLTHEGVDDWEKLEAFLTSKKKIPRPARTYLLPREERLALPDAPGIYRMHACDGSVLYVGKATSLKSRVSTYFKQKGLRGRLADMATQVTSISVVSTASPVDAALLENEEIKRLDPPYNTSLKSRTRRLVFMSRDLSESAPEPSDEFPYGPFPSARAFDDFREFLSLVRSGSVEPELMALVTGETATIQVSPEYWIRLGYKFLRAERRGIDFPELAEDAPDLDQMADAIRRVLRRVARALHRAHELCRWSEISVAWPSAESVWRWLGVEHGKLTSEGFLALDVPVPVPPGWNRPWRERQRRFDLTSYDSICVLSAEVTRLKTKGVPLRVRFSPYREFKPTSATNRRFTVSKDQTDET